jgi:hypothetical protein
VKSKPLFRDFGLSLSSEMMPLDKKGPTIFVIAALLKPVDVDKSLLVIPGYFFINLSINDLL